MARLSWDKDSILKMLRQLHRTNKDLSYTHLARSMQPLVSAAAYHFGSYRNAIAEAGIDYANVTQRPRWTKPLIIRTIKDARRKKRDLHWAAATARRDELSKAAFASLQPRLFGSWDRALHAAGLDADEISRYRKWDRNSIVFELKHRGQDDQPLNSGAVQRDDPGLHAAAVRHFGNYDDALRNAKLDPTLVRRRRRWTRESALAELRAFERRHKVLSDSAIRREDPALYGATLRMFKGVNAAKKILAKPRSGH